MIDWPIIIAGGLAVVIFFALLKLVRSVIRLIVAFVGAAIMTWIAYTAVRLLGIADVVPGAIFVLIGALSALLFLIRR